MSLEQRRNLLAAFIAQWKTAYKYKGIIYLVFDGNNNQIQTLEQSILHGIKCIYSAQKEEADDKIIGIIRSAIHPENITVISDDNFIANNVRSYGAHIKPVAFLVQQKKKAHIGKHKGQSEKKIDAATALRITDDMKKIWGVSD
jgi:predicted RNA-binding protein with PIN domain